MCDPGPRHGHARPAAQSALPAGRRRLWEIDAGLQCSIIGTCTCHDDLVRIAQKLKLALPRGASDYDVHSAFVQSAHLPGPMARALQKLLESRYATIMRKVRATGEADALAELWTRERDAGRVAGAYWAFLCHDHVPRDLQTRIFGEVHMLSHLLGRTVSRSAGLVSELQARIDDLEARHARQQERHRVVVAEREAALAKLAARDRPPAALGVLRDSRTAALRQISARSATRRERALLSARSRARSAEFEVVRLGVEVERLRALVIEAAAAAPFAAVAQPVCPAAAACDAAVREDIARRVLYIGGRSGAIDTLRRIAAERRAELIHHDGGEEMSVKRIDGLVEGCDAVFCPVDCVSHQACLKAKALCRKHGKPFVPLRSSGAASFERALTLLPARHPAH